MLSDISEKELIVTLSPIDTEEPITVFGPMSQLSPIEIGPDK
jgi:hypothetical protein